MFTLNKGSKADDGARSEWAVIDKTMLSDDPGKHQSVCFFIVSYVTDTVLDSGAVKTNKIDNIPALTELLA